MAKLNNLINRFVLQELGDITEGVRLVENMIEHIGINESNYFMYRWWDFHTKLFMVAFF